MTTDGRGRGRGPHAAAAAAAAAMGLLLLAGLAGLPGAAASYEDGVLRLGERYADKPRYKAQHYTVYQLPYGMSFYQAYVNGTVATLAMTHVPCPGGSNCNFTSTEMGFATLRLSDLSLLSLTLYTEAKAGRFVRQPYGQGTIPGSPDGLMMLTSNDTGKRLAVYDMPNAETSESRWLPDAFYPSLARVNPQSKEVHVFEESTQVDQPATLRVFDRYLLPVRQGSAHYATPTAMAVNPGLPAGSVAEVFVGTQTPDGGTHLVRYNESHPELATNITLTPGSGAGTVIPIVGLEVDPVNGELLVFRQNTSGIDNNNLETMQPVHVTAYVTANGAFVTKATKTFNSFEYAGAFFHADFVYVYTAGGQLVRFARKFDALTATDDDDDDDIVENIERMTLSFNPEDPCQGYVRGTQPYTYIAAVEGNDAWLLADWWGMLFKVDLTQFCPDTRCWRCDREHPKSKAWIAGLVVPLILVTAGALIFVGFRRGWWQSLRHRQRYDEIGAAGAAKGGAPATFNASSALGDRHL